MADVLKKVPVREQEPKVRATNFEEVCYGYNKEEAMEEATRCLNCKNARCIQGCPVSINIPAFIAEIKEGNIEEAYKVIGQSSALPAICGRVCPQESQCESKCVRGIKGDAVSIGKLERFVADYALENDIKPEKPEKTNGHKVAVIGSGPSGLTCAGDLAKLGYEVTVFEALHELGGVLVYGIPEFRLPKQKVVKKEIEKVKELGVKFETNVVIGKSTTIDQLMEEEDFEAVFIGSGAGLPMFMGIPGETANGVFSANEYLTRSNLMKAFRDDYDTPIAAGKKVAVVGGGNVAMDCARSAVRCNAEEVSIIYRRRQKDMTALESEIESAVMEGIALVTLQAPVEITKDENGNCKSLITQPQMISAYRGSRPAPKDAAKEKQEFKADVIMIAVGQDIVSAPFEEFGIPAKWNILQAGLDTEVKEIPGVFTGGDCATGPSTVIRAIAAGKVAAHNIDEYLGYHHTLTCEAVVPEPKENMRDLMGTEIGERPANIRKKDFEHVEELLTHEEAMQEACRCLRCDHFGCGAMVGGRDL